MTRPLVIVGCGGFGREVADIVDAINAKAPTWQLIGYLDDDPGPADLELLRRRGTTHLGGIAEVSGLPAGTHYVIGIGSGATRLKIEQALASTELTPAVLLHPEASIGWSVTLEPGAVVCAGARLTSNIVVGRHAQIHVNSTVGHDTVLDAGVSVYPLASVSGNCHLGEAVTLGTNSTVIQGLKVADGVMVGAGACVVRDVLAGATVIGVPARVVDSPAPREIVIPEPRSAGRDLP